MTRVVLVHGAATTAGVWDRMLPLLDEYDVTALNRPRTGDLERELAWLTPRVEGAWLVGMSGGATLGLALTSGDLSLAGAVLHEPAVGSLAPSLLAPMVHAFHDGGTAAFARTLYGDSWSDDLEGDAVDDAVTGHELAMFRAFEPAPPGPACGRVVVTCGERSPAVRHDAARALHAAYGHELRLVPGARHFAAHDSAPEFAEVVRAVIGSRDRR